MRSTPGAWTVRGWAVAVGLAMATATGVIATRSPEAATPLDPKAEIREKRERFNRAIEARDTAALALIWTADVRVVTSSGGRIEGRDAYRRRFAGYFADRRDYSYRRDPARIEVFEPWGIAAEYGAWRARWQEEDGPVDVGGEYLMQWTRADGEWRVGAELFVPLHCTGGAYCAGLP